jgi:hypothetical protein
MWINIKDLVMRVNICKWATALCLALLAAQPANGQFVNPRNGDMYIGYQDMAFERSGLFFEREYNSKETGNSLYGLGWTTSFDESVLTVPGKAVCYYFGSGAQDLYKRDALDSSDLNFWIDRMVAIAKENDKINSGDEMKHFRDRLLNDETHRDYEWRRLLREGKVDPLKLPTGTELIYQGCMPCGTFLLGEARHFLRVTDGGYSIKHSEETMDFDGAGRLIHLGGPCYQQHLEYDEQGKLFRVSDQKGDTVLITLDRSGKIVQLMNNSGKLARYKYSPLHFLVWSDDTDDNEYSFEYDKRGNMTAVQYRGYRKTLMSYASLDSFEDIRSIVDFQGNVKNYSYRHDLKTHYDTSVTVDERDAVGKAPKTTYYQFDTKKDTTTGKEFYRDVVQSSEDTVEKVFERKTKTAVGVYKNGVYYSFVYDTRNFVTRLDRGDGFFIGIEYLPGSEKIQAISARNWRWVFAYDSLCKFAGITLSNGEYIAVPVDVQDVKGKRDECLTLDSCLQILRFTYLGQQVNDLAGLVFFPTLIASNDPDKLYSYAEAYLYKEARDRQHRMAYLANAKTLLEKFVRVAAPDDRRMVDAYEKLVYIEIHNGRYASAGQLLAVTAHRFPRDEVSLRYLPLVYLLTHETGKAMELYRTNKGHLWSSSITYRERDRMPENTLRNLYLFDLNALEDTVLEDGLLDSVRRFLYTPAEYVRSFIYKALDQDSLAKKRQLLTQAADLCRHGDSKNAESKELLFRIEYQLKGEHDWSLFSPEADEDMRVHYAHFLQDEGNYERNMALRAEYYQRALQLFDRIPKGKLVIDDLLSISILKSELGLPFDENDDPRDVLQFLTVNVQGLYEESDTVAAGHYLTAAGRALDRLFLGLDRLKERTLLDTLLNDISLLYSHQQRASPLTVAALFWQYAYVEEMISTFGPTKDTAAAKVAARVYSKAYDNFFEAGIYDRSLQAISRATAIADSLSKVMPGDTSLREEGIGYQEDRAIAFLYVRDFPRAREEAEKALLLSNGEGYGNTVVIRSYLLEGEYDKAVGYYERVRNKAIAPGTKETYKAALLRQLSTLEKAGITSEAVTRFKHFVDTP